ncbi:MAG: hypothetical protein ABI824_09790 [Acidobacteriota bacterium]
MSGFDVACYAVMAAISIYKLSTLYQHARKRKQSLRWPMVRATLEAGSAHPVQDVESDRITWTWNQPFHYGVGNETYTGVYTEGGFSEPDVQRRLELFAESPFFVRYNPDNPTDYFVSPYRDVRENAE